MKLSLYPILARAGRSLLRAARQKPATGPYDFIVPSQRARFMTAQVSYYTPQQVEYIFQSALAGNLVQQWEMFDLMEATWPELSQCLNELKDATLNLRLEVVPFALANEDPSPEAQRRAKLVEELIWAFRPRPGADENDFEDTLRDLLDARAKGISVLEVDWETRRVSDGSAIGPRATRWVHPSWYAFDDEGDGLKLASRGDAGLPGPLSDFPDNKFIIGICKNKTGHPLGSAMLHVLGFWWAAANFTADAFFDLAQVFGQPIRWANYDPGMSSGDKAKLQAMLDGMGRQAWGMFPEGVTMELKEAAKSATDNPQKVLLDMANKICRLVVLRQTLTSDASGDGTGSRALGEVHERKESGVVQSCGMWACKTMTQLVRAICILNYGDDREMPWLKIAAAKESPKSLAEVLGLVKNAGLEPTDDELPEIGERLGFDVQRVIAPPAPAMFGQPNGENFPPAETKNQMPDADAPEKDAPPPAELQAAQSRIAENLGVPAGWLNPLRDLFAELEAKAADKSIRDEDLGPAMLAMIARVPEVFGRMNKDELADVLEAGMGEAVLSAARKNLRKQSAADPAT